MTALAALAGFLTVGGLAVAALSLRAGPGRPNATHSSSRRSTIASAVALVVAAAAFLAALVLTRWPIAALAAGVAGWVAGRDAEPTIAAARRSAHRGDRAVGRDAPRRHRHGPGRRGRARRHGGDRAAADPRPKSSEWRADCNMNRSTPASTTSPPTSTTRSATSSSPRCG